MLRVRLLLLVLLSVLPGLGLTVYTNLEQREAEKALVRQNVLAACQLVAANEANFIKNTRQIFVTLSDVPFLVRATSAAVPARHFANLLKLTPDYLIFGLIESNGVLFCSSMSSNLPVDLSDRVYFKRVLQSRQFVIGDYQIGRLTGKPTLNFGFPILDARGEIFRVMFAGLDLQLLSGVLARTDLPPGATAIVLDQSGNILAHSPNPGDWVGKSFPNLPVTRSILTHTDGTFEAVGMDGVQRLYAVTRIHDDEGPRLFVSVGFPLHASFAKANGALIRGLLILGLVGVAALLLAW